MNNIQNQIEKEGMDCFDALMYDKDKLSFIEYISSLFEKDSVQDLVFETLLKEKNNGNDNN